MAKYFYKEFPDYFMVFFGNPEDEVNVLIAQTDGAEKAHSICYHMNAGLTTKLIDALKNDGQDEGSYYYTWQANLAMAMYDEMKANWENVVMRDDKDQKAFFNAAAKRFLNLLINTKP